MKDRFDAVLFDLLSGLLDSWTLWNLVAGDPATGLRWRMRYLELTRAAGRYRDYLTIVGEAAKDTGVARGREAAHDLEKAWHTMKSWPEATAMLRGIKSRVPIGILTNCSVDLGERAVLCTGADFDGVVCAEASGWYKPAPEAYRAGLEAIGADAARTLFVAGSPFDVDGAVAAGMTTVLHDRAAVAGRGRSGTSGLRDRLPASAGTDPVRRHLMRSVVTPASATLVR